MRAYRYDGKSSRRSEVELAFGDDNLRVQGADIDLVYPRAAYNLQPRVGNAVRVLDFTDGSRCEVFDVAAIDALQLEASSTRRIHRFENKLHYALIALLLSVAVLWAIVQYGVPAAARVVAFAMPVETERMLGENLLEALDKLVFQPSTLSFERQQQLREQFTRVALRATRAGAIHFEFRNGKTIGANAFALPSGTIVFTDAMVTTAQHDEELIAVAAHEVGHVAQRHSLRHVLQDSITALVLIAATGDIGSVSSFAAALPTILLQMKYSREFETEADDYAFNDLKAAGIPTQRFSDLMERLEKQTADKMSAPAFLSSHPATAERVERFK